jgi:heme-binding NEAT domain protein
MRIWEAIYVKLNATTAITDLVGTSIFHGLRPDTDDTSYAINYFELPGLNIVPDAKGVIENPDYQISCRATTPGNAKQLAQEVDSVLHNMQEALSGFSISITVKQSSGGLIEEQDGDWWHVPLTYRFVYENTEN